MTQNEFSQGLFEDYQEIPDGRIIKNEFSPWHHPRKHLIRLEQWVHYINSYSKRILHDKKDFKYFSLPGDDLLDIRTIHEEFCLKKEIKMRFLGFNDHTSDADREQNANLSLAEVRGLKYIDKASQYHDNNILNINSKESLVYQRFKEFGDFDVINLDFCNSVTKHQPSKKDNNHYNFLSKIIQLQNHRDKPWLMFLTTRVGDGHVHPQTLEIFKRCFINNLSDDTFRNKAEQLLNIYDSDSLEKSLLIDDKFRKIVSTSFFKWMLTYSLSLTPKTTIKVLDVMEYKVYPKSTSPDMLSFALIFTPHHDQIHDPIGLAKSFVAVEKFREPTIASYYIERVCSATDCDKYLKERPDKKEIMTVRSIDLLKSARFDTSSYREQFP
ncbi:hypothetical protein SNN91_000413 [Cronobacter sakazakii]|nr:hypothetical protein [Cronobacter sakazakii]ELY2690358.1 hypothetical protein [Cronobacter sakazakii]ELY5945995.1 hypothetical protein [Cronobacter sakazakii]